MKRIILLFAFVAGFTTITNAQDVSGGNGRPPMSTPEQKADKMTQRLQEQLKLSPDQTQKIHDIMLVRAQKMEKMREQGGQPDEAAMQQRRSMMKYEDEQINMVLNPQQREQYAKMRADMRDRRMENRGQMQQPNNMQQPTNPAQAPGN